MKKIYPIIIIPIAIIIMLWVTGFNPESKNDDVVFHVTLADPKLYIDGKYTEDLFLNKGEYLFRFVPNGDSPRILSINLYGSTDSFSEDFILEGTKHESGSASYFTWDYLGDSSLIITEEQKFVIEIDPNGNLAGPVSVDLISRNMVA